MGKKLKYISDGYIAEMEHYIHNNLSPLDHPSYAKTMAGVDKSKVKEILKKGEKYIWLEEELEDVVITSLGRAVSVDRLKQYSVKFSTNIIILYLREIKVDIVAIFEEQGWPFNIEQIRKNYNKYDWKFIDSRDYFKN